MVRPPTIISDEAVVLRSFYEGFHATHINSCIYVPIRKWDKFDPATTTLKAMKLGGANARHVHQKVTFTTPSRQKGL